VAHAVRKTGGRGAPQHVLGLAHPQAVLLEPVLCSSGQVPEFFAKQIPRAAHAGRVRVTTFPRRGIYRFRVSLLVALACVEGGVHLCKVRVTTLELVAPLLTFELLHHRRQVGGAPGQRDSAVHEIDALTLGIHKNQHA
jgi:hypothetical protein